jgi:hypothetical protein
MICLNICSFVPEDGGYCQFASPQGGRRPLLTRAANSITLSGTLKAMTIRTFRQSAALRALGAVLLLAVLTLGYLVAIRKDMTDLGVCYKAGQRIRAGEMLYRASDGHLQYKYAPVAACFYGIFAFFPWETAKILWYLLSLAALAATGWLTYRLIPEPKKKAGFILGMTFLVMLKYLGRELQLGQVNILIIFMLTAMSVLFIAGKDFWSGVVWGVSLIFKPYALVFLPYFALKKRGKVLIGGLAAVAAGLIVPAIDYGVRGNWEILKAWKSSLSQSTPVLLTVGDNSSLFAFVLKVLHGQWNPGAIAVLSLSASAIGLGFLYMMFKKKTVDPRTSEVTELAFLFVLIPLFSPLGWYYNYLYGFLAVMIMLYRLGEFPSGLKWTAIINFCIIGGTLREVLGKTLFRFYTHHSLATLNFLVVLALLFYLQVKAPRQAS